MNNVKLPPSWRFRYNAYYYRVPAGQESKWDDKKEFRLDADFAKAKAIFNERVKCNDTKVRTIADLMTRYAAEVIPNKAESTHAMQYKYCEVLQNYFGNTLASAIKQRHCYELLAAYTKKHGDYSGNRLIEVFSHAMTCAVKWGLIDQSPFFQFKKNPRPARKMRIPSRDEVYAALPVANKTLQLYVRLKMWTGARQTDILSITHEQIKADGLHITPSKTKNTTATKLIFAYDDLGHLKRLLNEIDEHCRHLSRKAGGRDTRQYLFHTRSGIGYLERAIRADGTLEPWKKKNGIASMWQRWQAKAVAETTLSEPFCERSLRNVVANSFGSVSEAREHLGHADERTTRTFYYEKPTTLKPSLAVV